MTTTNQPRHLAESLLFLVVFLSPMTGCGRARDLFLWKLGCICFLTYLMTVAATVIISRLHEWPRFLRLVDRCRRGIACAASTVVLAGIAVLVVGLTRLGEPWGPDKLLFLEGSLVVAAGLSLLGWARTTVASRRLLYAKLVTASVLFAIALGYVMAGAEMAGG